MASEEDIGEGNRGEVNEDVDGSLMVPLFGGHCFHILESVPKHFEES